MFHVFHVSWNLHHSNYSRIYTDIYYTYCDDDSRSLTWLFLESPHFPYTRTQTHFHSIQWKHNQSQKLTMSRSLTELRTNKTTENSMHKLFWIACLHIKKKIIWKFEKTTCKSVLIFKFKDAVILHCTCTMLQYSKILLILVIFMIFFIYFTLMYQLFIQCKIM